MNRFTIPRDIYFGENALHVLKTLEGTKAVLVIGGSSMKKNGNLDKIQRLLSEANIETKVIDGITTEPTTQMVKKGVRILNDFQPDWVIGIGGGSVMDAAKAMWLFYEHPELTFEEATRPFSLPRLRTKAKFVGIPTTSGSASEISNLSVITDAETGIKYPLADFELTPDMAIIDPIMVQSMPKHVTAYSGMDAITHSIEAYVAKPRTIFTDSLAIEAAQVLKENLLASYQGDAKAREQVHYAQAMAGMAFANAVLGNVHSLSHKSGPIFNIPHGCANAIYLPYVIQFNRTVVEDRYAAIAKRLGLHGENHKELVDSLIAWIRDLNGKMNIPNTLQEYGVSEDMFNAHVDEMAANAVKDPCTSTNPRDTSVEEMKKLYVAAFYGLDVNF
ncbi:iron-containing alcohol dehydrogenase [Parageobacillus thermoglucosidasius]|uniref:long-chain-alcohol dehydrogenase n=1 Tax=Geobacillus sp. (strain Y4.1MC1) TaxID=581103 RepID=A0A7U4DM26_GEOS0|nr:iron-containing alcohol dehydrogenase [Parageobacillus thermoglucosidasius]KYD15561.1 Alcohol dehydrogenase [Anoxybacillus flavithermus]EID43603.1 butanol dehydrogenase, NADPH-dependent [Parageobacillus thermoglucosidasius TNO-09.020]OAO86310.1 Alcohol dehydrogenase Acetaldehyde dehydrogenase [Parageobacillus thermoglucosidasius]RDE28871.1 iron-containing alcohol dehydrogenase [Parageobacillus thermoglucosidasius]RDE33966.1 iron-containing alcohol dehydrogenase [Parageobacillus thermoglucos